MDSLLTANEVAKIINCSPSTIYSWAESGKLPTCHINGLLRFDKNEILKYVNKSRESIKSPRIPTPKTPKADMKISSIVKKNIASVKNEIYNSQIKGKSDLDQAPEGR